MQNREVYKVIQIAMARKKRNTFRKSNKSIYFIVEGCTEENYIKLLKTLYRKNATIKNCNGGSANKVLKEAQKIINKNGDDYKGYVIWFDRDTYNSSKDSNLFNSLRAKNNVEIYISVPCVENWLLAHFQEVNQNESKCNRCVAILKQKYITRYEKNDCNMLTRFIAEEEISKAIINYPVLQGIPKVIESNQLMKN